MERETTISKVTRSETPRRRRKSNHSIDTIIKGLECKEEVKKEFQDYLNNSCDVWKRKEKDDKRICD